MCIKTKKLALKIILGISIAGMVFSGYLSYTELIQKVCAIGGSCTTIGSIPACVYGFIMYLILLVVSILGLRAKK